MIIDITGIELIPGNFGRDCPGNGKHYDKFGDLLEQCCNECDYLLCCIDEVYEKECMSCNEIDCPRYCDK